MKAFATILTVAAIVFVAGQTICDLNDSVSTAKEIRTFSNLVEENTPQSLIAADTLSVNLLNKAPKAFYRIAKESYRDHPTYNSYLWLLSCHYKLDTPKPVYKKGIPWHKYITY